MKVRIKFAKTGALVYIGHLDVMRYFQKLFRRSDIPICYSEGFSPHQILSFSHPLPLGMESSGEYADIEISEPVNSKEAITRLKSQSVPEIEIMSFKELPEKAENAMASVKAARYIVDLGELNIIENIDLALEKLMNERELIVTKVTKKATKEIDIRPLIFECSKEEDNKIMMLISSGSSDNLKPELVMNAIALNENISIDVNELKIKRIDQYTYVNDKLISLNDIGRDII